MSEVQATYVKAYNECYALLDTAASPGGNKDYCFASARKLRALLVSLEECYEREIKDLKYKYSVYKTELPFV